MPNTSDNYNEEIPRNTQAALFEESVQKYGDRPCFGYVDQKSVKTVTFKEVWRSISRFVEWMVRDAGLENSQSTKVGFYTANSFNARMMYHSVLCTKMVSVPVYPSLGRESILDVFGKTAVSMVVVDDEAKISTLLDANLSGLKTVLCLSGDIGDEIRNKANKNSNRQIRIFDFSTILKENTNERAEEILFEKPEESDLAFLLSSSGTTGNPKIIMLTQKNYATSTRACSANFEKLYECRIRNQHFPTFYALLPEAHTLGQLSVFMMLQFGCCIVYPSNSADLKSVLFHDLKIVKPIVLSLVPLLMDRVVLRINAELEKSYKAYFVFKLSTLLKNGLGIEWAAKYMAQKLRNLLGGNLALIVAGGAPLHKNTYEFFTQILRLSVVQGYGMSEGIVSQQIWGVTGGCNVGRPLASVELKLDCERQGGSSSNGRGEILVKGEGIFTGYFGDPETTKKAFCDGYFRTGDVGELDGEGNLTIVDRISDLFKHSNGEFICLSKIENVYKMNDLINSVAVIGKGGCKFLTGLVFVVEEKVQELQMEFFGRSAKIDENQKLFMTIKVLDLVESHLEESEQNSGLSGFEKVKLWTLVYESTANLNAKILTPTFKIKRKCVEQHYSGLIERMEQLCRGQEKLAKKLLLANDEKCLKIFG